MRILGHLEVWSQSVRTDHMITCQWNSTRGRVTPHLELFGPLQLMPTASILHYATECFEGLKCYRGHDLKLRLVRPDCNTWRILKGSIRISLPTFDPDELLQLIETLVAVEGEKWLPKSRPGTFLYLRLIMIATAAALGCRNPRRRSCTSWHAAFQDLTHSAEQPDRVVTLHHSHQKRG